jgi:hypothetical protein
MGTALRVVPAEVIGDAAASALARIVVPTSTVSRPTSHAEGYHSENAAAS